MPAFRIEPFLGVQPNPLTPVFVAGLGCLLLLLAGVVAVFVALYLYRGWERLASRSLARVYDGLKIHEPPRVGDVLISYHTYHGVLVWFTQTHHVVALPAADARILLDRLLRFNLSYGLLAQGSFLVAPLVFFNYLAQRRAVTRQQTEYELADLQPTVKSSDSFNSRVSPPDLGNFYKAQTSPSIILQLTGWVCAMMTPLFAITAVVALCRGEFQGAVGGAVMVWGFVWIADGWTCPPVFSSLVRRFRNRRFACCSFCRGNFVDVGPLLEGPGEIYICGNCCLAAASQLDRAVAQGACSFCTRSGSATMPLVKSASGTMICGSCLEIGLLMIEEARSQQSKK
jgi:hypothetical protein